MYNSIIRIEGYQAIQLKESSRKRLVSAIRPDRKDNIELTIVWLWISFGVLVLGLTITIIRAIITYESPNIDHLINALVCLTVFVGAFICGILISRLNTALRIENKLREEIFKGEHRDFITTTFDYALATIPTDFLSQCRSNPQKWHSLTGLLSQERVIAWDEEIARLSPDEESNVVMPDFALRRLELKLKVIEAIGEMIKQNLPDDDDHLFKRDFARVLANRKSSAKSAFDTDVEIAREMANKVKSQLRRQAKAQLKEIEAPS